MDNNIDYINPANNLNEILNRYLNSSHIELSNSYKSIIDSSKPLNNYIVSNKFQDTILDTASIIQSVAINPQNASIQSFIKGFYSSNPYFETLKDSLSYQQRIHEQLLVISKPLYSEKININHSKTLLDNLLKQQILPIYTSASLVLNVQPTIDIAKTFSKNLNLIPNIDFRIKNMTSELSDILSTKYTSLEEIYYPPEEEIDEFLNDTFHDEIATDILLNKEQYSQQELVHQSYSKINSQKINESVHKTEFLSKFTDPWWYANFTMEIVLELLLVGIIGYVTGKFDYVQFVFFFNQLLKLFKLTP